MLMVGALVLAGGALLLLLAPLRLSFAAKYYPDIQQATVRVGWIVPLLGLCLAVEQERLVCFLVLGRFKVYTLTDRLARLIRGKDEQKAGRSEAKEPPLSVAEVGQWLTAKLGLAGPMLAQVSPDRLGALAATAHYGTGNPATTGMLLGGLQGLRGLAWVGSETLAWVKPKIRVWNLIRSILCAGRLSALRIEAEYGTNNPAATGMLCGWLQSLRGLTLPYLKLQVVPNFQQQILKGTLAMVVSLFLGKFVGLMVVLRLQQYWQGWRAGWRERLRRKPEYVS